MKKLIALFLAVWMLLSLTACGTGSSSSASGTAGSDKEPAKQETTQDTADETTSAPADEQEEPEDLSNVAKEYTLTAGYFTAGIDIPSGTCDVTAVSGTGNLSSSNLLSGGVNEMFGIDDGNGLYTPSFNGLQLPEGTVLSVNSNLVIKLTYKTVESNFSGRTYDDANAITLSTGNYTAGTDFTAGTYKIVATSGTGNLSSSNLIEGGVNEMFGVDDGTGLYNNQFLNADLPEGTTLKVSGGVSIQLIQAATN